MVVVRAEEILLVALVLVIWVAAIALFFNRWGKIRMLEPYQPKFQQSHRASCPLSPPTTQVSTVKNKMLCLILICFHISQLWVVLEVFNNTKKF